MIRSFLIGLVAGQRAMTPLAVLAGAARNGLLAPDAPGAKLLTHPLVAAGAVTLASGEMAGDKMKSAPDRIVPSGLAARLATGAFAGAVLAPSGRRRVGALIGAGTAVASSYLGWSARMAALRRFGQTPTGIVEDAVVLAAGQAIAGRGNG
ncbi:DUF4126 domain-containing protein [Sphingomonas sp.]|uniref:DUF4126 domain-containing protein n=1 Tax=Sphingomonas sp. TaxID=28214 RepID=UPI003CC6140C